MLDRRESLLSLLAATLAPSLAKASPLLPIAPESPVRTIADTAPAPLSDRSLDNLIAYTRILGYVRHFHPSDQAAAADWQMLAVEGAARAESCADAEALARTLTEFFAPVAPSLQIFVTGRAPAFSDSGAIPAKTDGMQLTAWIHVGPGQDNALTAGFNSVYSSRRYHFPIAQANTPDLDLDPAQPYEMALAGGISCRVPLILFTNLGGTLPHPAAAGSSGGAALDPAQRVRAARLASVALLWNVLQHFYPYFHVVKVDWMAQLPRALRAAATDKSDEDFDRTLGHMIVAIQDGHGYVARLNRPRPGYPPFQCAWIENSAVVTHLDEGKDAGGVARGDVIVSIDGVATAQVVADALDVISGSTPQWRYYVAMYGLLRGPAGSAIDLVIDRGDGQNRRVRVARSENGADIQKRYTPIFSEPRPGICYFDMDGRCTPADFEAALPKLLAAKGIVFDMRSYPNKVALEILPRLSDQTLRSAKWMVPIVWRPDRTGKMAYNEGGRWTLPPITPRFTGRVAFITDGRAISYADSVMAIVEYYRLGEIVGGPTAGTNGNILFSPLPAGYRVGWTGMRVVRHDGAEHHGHGIPPTVPVAPTIRGVREGRDELLERAIAVVGG